MCSGGGGAFLNPESRQVRTWRSNVRFHLEVIPESSAKPLYEERARRSSNLRAPSGSGGRAQMASGESPCHPLPYALSLEWAAL